MASGIGTYNTTPVSNSSINGIDISENCAPSGINDAIRQLMADIRAAFDDGSGKASSTGTNTITLTTETAYTAYVNGMLLAFIAGGTNTGAATLNVNSIGAKAVLKSGGTALASGDIQSGQLVIVGYNSAANGAAGAWMLVNPDVSAFLTSAAIGVSVQAYNALLAAIAALSMTADNLIYGTGADTVALAAITAFGRSIVAGANAAAVQSTLSLVPGTNVQAYDADLAALAALASTGLISRTGPGAAAARSLANGTGIAAITNPDGVAGNPSIAVDKATTANMLAATSNKVVTADGISGATAAVALTDGATINVDHTLGVYQTVTLGGNRTMAAPTNTIVGREWIVKVTQDATGSRTLTWNAAYHFGSAGAPTLTTTANASDLLAFMCTSSGVFTYIGSTLNM